METKRCYHCKQIKPLSDFTKDKRNKDGLSGICRACKKLYNQAQKEYQAEYRKEHRHKYKNATEPKKISRANYKAVVYGAFGTFTKQDISDCLDFFGHECAYSGVPLTKGYSLDHVVPLSKGGANDIYNIVPCLEIVNIRKATFEWEAWYVRQPYYSRVRHQRILEWLSKREG